MLRNVLRLLPILLVVAVSACGSPAGPRDPAMDDDEAMSVVAPPEN